MPASTPSLSEYKLAILDLLPDQGCWTENEYLSLTDHTRRLVEYTDGQIEPVPLATDFHQSVLTNMFIPMAGFVAPLGGTAHFAAIRLRIRPGKFRVPDILLVKDAKDSRRRNRYWLGADLTLEVVSKVKPERDLVGKVHDYAEGNVPEYWIVNPQTETITVLRLENAAYVEHGVFVRGQIATSVILTGFKVAVDDVFNVDSPPDNPDDDDQ